MKKRVAILCGLVLTLTLVVMAQTNSGIFRITNSNFILNGGLGFESSAGNGMDAALVRTGANALKVTQGDGATAAGITASTGIFSSTASLTLGTAGTAVGQALFTNATSGSVTVAPPTGALGTPTVTLPALTGSLPTVYACGTIAANGACANTALAGTAHIVTGIATLASNTSTITGLSPAFTSSSSYFCEANDITTRANPVQAIPASGSTVTFTNTTGATDNISFVCVGN